MIAPEVLRGAVRIRDAFQHAKPYRHVMIDNFLDTTTAEALIAAFPRFDERKAINEHGTVGGKAVVESISGISPCYGEFSTYINSPRFLYAMSELIGIPELIADETLFGGGTHENLDGQALDVHVDFNFDERRMLHRRANLLIYLNKGWDARWGGAIDLHTNPWHPEADEVRSFLPLFNRAVIFETNECSWHGFKRIELPADRKHLSRKSLSIYLCTRDRPVEEVVAPHATFYGPRPRPATFGAGVTLSEGDAQEIRIAMQSRDGLIRMYQKLLVEKGQQLRDLVGARQGLLAAGLPANYDVILRSRSWRMIMNAHRLRYWFGQALRSLGRRARGRNA